MSDPVLTPLLSIDPSSNYVGWALVGPAGSYLSSGVLFVPGMESDDRVVKVGELVFDLVNSCRPASILIELPNYITDRANPENLIKYFRAVGAAEFAATRFGLPVHRDKATKYRYDTQKKDRMRRFQSLVGRPPLRDDESDAFCMGLDFLFRGRTGSAPDDVPPM